MSQPPQGQQPPYGPGGPPPSGDQPTPGGSWGQPPQPQQPGPGWGQPTPARGQGGPGGPGRGGPVGTGAPGGGDGRKKNVVTTLVAALAVVIVVAVVLIVTPGGDDSPGSTASGADASTAPSTSSGSSSSGGFSSAPSGTTDPAAFVAQLPSDFTDCTATAPAGDGDLVAASCGSATTHPGPAEAEFYLYPDLSTLDSTFQTDVTAESLTDFPPDANCSTGTGTGEWKYTDGSPGGQFACWITDAHVLVAWTDNAFLTEGVVRAPGTTQGELSALYDWWTQHSRYQG
jgi:hypothetical protein